MSKVPHGFDPFYKSSAGTQYHARDEANGDITLLVSEDLTDVLDHAKRMATHNDGYSESRELRRVAIIPNIIALKWLHEEGWWYQDPNARDKLLKKLDDPDYAHLRTAPGRVGRERRML